MKSGVEQLRDWMHRRRFLQTEVADYLGLDKTWISQIINGHRSPSLENAVLIERGTGIPVEAWLSTDRDKSDEPVSAGARKSRNDKA